MSGARELVGDESLRRIAARWHERLQREAPSQETKAAFEHWRGSAREHAEAYEAVERTWQAVRSAAHDPRILELRHETALRLTTGVAHGSAGRTASRLATGSWARPVKWAVAAVMTMIVAGGVLFAVAPREFAQIAELAGFGRDRGNQRFVTQIGERLAVDLPDGTQITLNTQTELRTAFDASERRVVLARGQALFEVAKEGARPFVVEAQGRRFVAVGTTFDVRVEGGRVQLTMLEGVVNVERMDVEAGSVVASPQHRTSETSPSGGGSADVGAMPMADKATAAKPPTQARRRTLIATIVAGEQLTVDAERVDRVRVADTERVASWRRGLVVFEDTRLADAIAEINRYSETQIALAEGHPEIGELRLSGAFATGRTTVFLEAVTTYFPVRVVRADDDVIVLAPREEDAASGAGSGFVK